MVDIKKFVPVATLAYKNKFEYIVEIYDKTSCEKIGWLHINNWKLIKNDDRAWWLETFENTNIWYNEEDYNKSIEMALPIAKAHIELLEEEGTL